ncbi:hypothetical protein H0H93_002049 [Arthromyces matolae]|nr:hypothetical protein H0H93_002049 [Arthromyces matolae]
MSFKRVLTDELRESLSASNVVPSQSTHDDDLAAQLRSIGARVRKNVTEGYRSPPSSFSRSQSTGSIFQSAQDSLAQAKQSCASTNSMPASRNKRSHPLGESDRGCESDGAADEDNVLDMDIVDTASPGTPSIYSADSTRPIKPLRRKGMLQTRSLPSNIFALGESHRINDPGMNTVKEEDDWSIGDFSPQGFESVESIKDNNHQASL